ncbi:MAG: hypothetical protein RMJ56_06880 [Gemmataceae bacterium]|nr:hypothetical protein [Gemmata sp.]MDW8197313.1 hypothetical protein [Gemmataceae bacterium]
MLAVFLFDGDVSASASDYLAQAEAAFAEGVSLRNDSVKARQAFAKAAAAYDALWHAGYHSPALAINRARAHRLAGDLPRCLAALHSGLAVTPYSRPLQVELEDARAAVQYPLDRELVQQAQPPPIRGWNSRVAPTDQWIAVGGLWLLLWLGVARFLMTRRMVWLLLSLLGTAALIVWGLLWWYDVQRFHHDHSRPLLIVTHETLLRRGNAVVYPPRWEVVLPRGTEVRELTRRGGWVQVQLAGGAVGWLPEGAIVAVEPERRPLNARHAAE